jgi:hypothetical protein
MALALALSAAAPSLLAKGVWLPVDRTGAGIRQLAATPTYLFALRKDGTLARMARDGVRGATWEDLDADADNTAIAASGERLYVIKESREVWRADIGVFGTGRLAPPSAGRIRVDRWRPVPGTEEIEQISAAGPDLYSLAIGGDVKVHREHYWRWVSRGLNVVELDAAGQLAWLRTDGGDVWVRRTRPPRNRGALDRIVGTFRRRQDPLSRRWDRGDAVEIHGGTVGCFVLTRTGEIYHLEGGVLPRLIGQGAQGGRLTGVGDGVLFVTLPDGRVWRYVGERWGPEFESFRARSVHARGEDLFMIGRHGSVWTRVLRSSPEIGHYFGMIDFGGAGAGVE